jgi:hypothetical protein
MLLLFVAVAVPLAAQPVTSYDEVVFETTGAQMWGPPGVVSKSFQVHLLNEELDPVHLSFLNGDEVPNPEYLLWVAAYESGIALGLTPTEVIEGKETVTAEWLAWSATYESLRALGWSDSEARNGKTIYTEQWLAWKAAYDSLRALGWTDSQARNGKTTCIVSARYLAWKACMATFNSTGICGGKPAKYSSCTTLPGAGSEPTKYKTLPGAGPEPTKTELVFKGIGPAPPETIEIGEGIELDVTNARLIGGFEGDVGILDGGVDAKLEMTSQIWVNDTTVQPGETVYLHTRELWSQSPELETNITLFSASIGAFMRSSAKMDFRVFSAGAPIFDETILDFDTGMLHQELAGLTIQGGPNHDIELRVFGQDVWAPAIPDQNYNINCPFLIPPPYSFFVGFPMADVSLFVPDMQTPPHSQIDEYNSRLVRNAQLPIDREMLSVVGSVMHADKIRIDLARFDVDFDVSTVIAGWPEAPIPLGVVAGVPVVAQVEVNVEDWDAGAYFSFAQDMSFEPKQIDVTLHFSEPVGIFDSAGDMQWVTEHTVELGDALEFEHPGGTVVVTPEYVLADNEFRNKTDFVISPVQTTVFLQIKFMGLLLAGLGAPTDYTVYQGTLPLWEPIHAANVFDSAYALGGFNRVMGEPITIYGSVPPAADAGADQVVHARTLVALDGSASTDPDGNLPLTYEWQFTSKPDGSTALLMNATSVSPTFTPDMVGDFVVRLVVTDAVGLESEPDDVTVTATNVTPIADAGADQAVIETDTVVLSGLGSSDADLDPLTYEWSIVSMPSGSAAALDDPGAAKPSFAADMPGEYVIRLVVNDGFASSELDETMVTATPILTSIRNDIQAMIDYINGLPDGAFSNKNNRKTLVNKLEAILKQVDGGDYAEALEKLNDDVFEKMDGYPTSGAVEKTDWIVDAGAQAALVEFFRNASRYLTRLV